MTATRGALVAALLCALSLGAGCASGSKEAAGAPKTYKESRTQVATATVTAIDPDTRMVTLKSAEGETYTFRASDEVRNLDQVRVGDQVKVEYTESIVVDVKKSDGSAPDAAVVSGATRAAPGEKPGGAVGQATTISAVIVAIDRETNRVTLKGPAGNTRVLQVKDPKKLEGVNVGDMVFVTYTEAIAISVHEMK